MTAILIMPREVRLARCDSRGEGQAISVLLYNSVRKHRFRRFRCAAYTILPGQDRPERQKPCDICNIDLKSCKRNLR